MRPPADWNAPAKKSSTGKIIAIVCLVVGLLCLGGAALAAVGIGGAASVVEQESTDRAADLKIDKCDTNVLGLVDVSYTIVNSSSVARSYAPQFNIVTNDGTIVGSAADFTPDVPAGGTFKGTAMATLDDSSKRLKITCQRISA
jgi:hypothetical protein